MKFTPTEWSTFLAFEDIDDRKKHDDQTASKEVLYYTKMNDIVYMFQRATTKKILMLRGKELVFANAWKRISDKFVVEISISYQDKHFPILKNLDRMYPLSNKLYFTKIDDANLSDIETTNETKKDCWKVNQYIFVDPKLKIPVKLLKKPMNSYYKHWYTNIFNTMDEYLVKYDGDMSKVIDDKYYKNS